MCPVISSTRTFGLGRARASGHLSRRLHHFSKTGEGCEGFQGTGEYNELRISSLPCPYLTTKVARRRHFSKGRHRVRFPPPPPSGDSPNLNLQDAGNRFV